MKELCKECKHHKTEPVIGVGAYIDYCELLDCKFDRYIQKMKLIDADELLECLWREDVSSREKIAEIVNRQPIIAYAKIKTEIVITQKGLLK